MCTGSTDCKRRYFRAVHIFADFAENPRKYVQREYLSCMVLQLPYCIFVNLNSREILLFSKFAKNVYTRKYLHLQYTELCFYICAETLIKVQVYFVSLTKDVNNQQIITTVNLGCNKRIKNKTNLVSPSSFISM